MGGKQTAGSRRQEAGAGAGAGGRRQEQEHGLGNGPWQTAGYVLEKPHRKDDLIMPIAQGFRVKVL